MQPASVTVTAAPGQRAKGRRARLTGDPPAPGAPSVAKGSATGMARRLGVVRNVLPSPLDMHTLRAARGATSVAGSSSYVNASVRRQPSTQGSNADPRIRSMRRGICTPQVLRSSQRAPG
jgi:hypothetical protein